MAVGGIEHLVDLDGKDHQVCTLFGVALEARRNNDYPTCCQREGGVHSQNNHSCILFIYCCVSTVKPPSTSGISCGRVERSLK